MKIDHSDFIARHHKAAASQEAAQARPRASIGFMMVISILYLSACLAVAVILDIQKMQVLSAGVTFMLVATFTILMRQIFFQRKAQERETDLLREVLEGSRGGRLVTDATDHAVFANEKFKEICAPAAPSLQNFVTLFAQDPDTLAHFRSLADHAYRGLTDTIELRLVREERETWYRIIAQPIAGHAGYIHWRVDDITQKHSVERTIREDREKLIDFTDNAPVGFFSVDENGRFVFVNATFARWVGEDIQTMLDRGTLHTYIVDPPKGAHLYDILPKGGAKQMAEVQMKGPGGRTFSASISQAVVHESPGVVRTRGVVHDLTGERAMRQALQASEDRFQRFFEEAPLGIAILNSQGLLDDCNPALGGMLGFPTEELAGKHFEALAHEDDRQEALSALKRIEQGRRMKTPVEVKLLGRDKEIVVQMYARRLEDSDNIVLNFIDLTEQKALEQQFVQSQKMQAIGQLAGGVAHDFNNLLTAMIGFCDLLLLRHKPGDPSFSDIMQIKQNANRAANLVRQLLAFSRQQTLRPKVQDITDILTEVSHLLRRLIGANIELDVIHGQSLGLVRVDAGQMEQVLINLAVNARDAMDSGGRVTIRTFSYTNRLPVKRGSDDMPIGHWVAVEVTDTGCGIPEENLTRIFEPFFTTKDVGQGTGLGLATVYGIVRQTGGYLHVDSEIGKGTAFTIYVPRLSEAESIPEARDGIEVEDAAPDLTGTALILLVEDEDAVRTFGARALSNKGYEMLEAESGEAALEVLSRQNGRIPDLVITDVIMPNMDGPTLAKRLREQSPDLKIIFISGYTEEKLKDHMGANIWFLPKPFTLKQLAAKVKEALAQ
jgi:two-component system, cell cycle sensor histidine kinase and response regulator CckA